VKVSLNIYGEQARTLARELGLECSRKTADAPMAAHFTYRNVEGHTVVAAQFTSKDVEEVNENNRTKTEQEFLDAAIAYCKKRGSLNV
jgi:hypothetical protein